MKEEFSDSIKVYLTGVATSVSALYIFNEFLKPTTSPTSPVSKSLDWKPLSNEDIQNIRFIIENK